VKDHAAPDQNVVGRVWHRSNTDELKVGFIEFLAVYLLPHRPLISYKHNITVTASKRTLQDSSMLHGNSFSGGVKFTRSGKILRFSTEIAVYLRNITR